ncbi:MAG: hypothetical protein R3212_05630 [Xanthomonadales bacterium]|nr:hypothetical protein [Xanthomonadales bacterium]
MTNRDSANRGELLPLPLHPWQCETAMCPQLFSPDQVQAYARANVERALAESREECERLRTELAQIALESMESSLFRSANRMRIVAEARAERLAGDLAATRACALHYLAYLHIPEPERALQADLKDESMCGDAALNLEPEA